MSLTIRGPGTSSEFTAYTVPARTRSFARAPERTAGGSVRVLGDHLEAPSSIDVRVHVRDDTAYVHVPASASNYLWTGPSATFDIAGDVDMRIRMRLPSLTQSGRILGKRGYWLNVNADGTVTAQMELAGTGFAYYDSTAPLPSTILTSPLWVRMTFDVNNGASGHTASFYTSTDGTSWTALGTPVVTAGVVALDTVSATLAVASGAVEVNAYAAEVYSGIDGTLIASFDADDITQITTPWTGAAGNTWAALGSPECRWHHELADAYALAYDIIALAELAESISTHEGIISVNGILGYAIEPAGVDALVTLRFAPTSGVITAPGFVLAPLGTITATGLTPVIPTGVPANAVTYGTETVTYDAAAVTYEGA